MDINDLLPFYALGVLTQEEMIFVERHLEEDPSLLEEVATLRAVTNALPLSVEPILPSDQVKHDLLQQVEKDIHAHTLAKSKTSTQQKLHTSWLIYLKSLFKIPAFAGLAVLSAAVLLWGSFMFTRLIEERSQLTNLVETVNEHTEEIANLALENETLQIDNATLTQQVYKQTEILAIYTHPDSIATEAFGTRLQPDANGRLTRLNANKTGIFAVNGLAQLSPEQIYQLWFIKDSLVVSIGTFSVDDAGNGEMTITLPEAFHTFTAIGVSIEPLDGSEQPTGDIIMSGALEA